MQVCTLLQTDNHASTPPLSFLQAGCPSCRPTNSVKALKASGVEIVTRKRKCFCKIQFGFTFLVTSYLGNPVKRVLLLLLLREPPMKVYRLRLATVDILGAVHMWSAAIQPLSPLPTCSVACPCGLIFPGCLL